MAPGDTPRRSDAVRLTAIGRKLAQLPLDPRLGRMVLEAGRLGCLDEVLIIAAGLSVQDPARASGGQAGRGRRAARPF